MIDLGGMVKHFGGMSTSPHVVVALFGRFQNDVCERHHLMSLAAPTKGGLEPRTWIGWLPMSEYVKLVCTVGRCLVYGDQSLQASGLELELLSRLGMIHDSRPNLIAQDVVGSQECGIYTGHFAEGLHWK